jgi:prepilin-type N-terminal cleavage/methylation domain-containing protein
MRKNTQSGVTLVEILIAVSLLSLLSVGMLVAMRLGFSTMDKTDAQLVKNRRVSNTRAILENEISGYVWSYANFRPQPDRPQQVPFLQAESQSMRFVTSYSIGDSWRGRLHIAALQVIPGENNRGVRLIVNETPYTGPDQAGTQIAGIDAATPARPMIVHYTPIIAGAQSFVLADRLAYCRFSWLAPADQPPFRQWRPDLPLPGILPYAVRIEMAPLDTNATDLRNGTVTVQFNVNRTPNSVYADQL